MHEPWFQARNGWTLKGTVAGGMALVPAVGERWEQMTKTPIYQGYGLTETSPVVTLNPFHRPKRESIGVPVPGTDVRIVDDDGQRRAGRAAGRTAGASGPQVMQGYWQRPDETARVLQRRLAGHRRRRDADDDGYLQIVDRKKDMILVSGFNVYPNEVEAVMAAHPGVAEVAVVGVPGSAVRRGRVAFVVRRDPALTEDGSASTARKSLTSYKVPRTVVFRDDLPKSNVGKVLRKDLRCRAGGARGPWMIPGMTPGSPHG